MVNNRFILDRLPLNVRLHYEGRKILDSIIRIGMECADDGSGIVHVFYNTEIADECETWQYLRDGTTTYSIWKKINSEIIV